MTYEPQRESPFARAQRTQRENTATRLAEQIAVALIPLSTADRNRVLLSLSAWIIAQLEALETDTHD